jgi:hypothetical protein
MDVFRNQKEQDEFVDFFCKLFKISKKQEQILCKIQRSAHTKHSMFLSTLPQKVINVAIKAEENYNFDKKLIKLIKKYWDKNGIAINQ